MKGKWEENLLRVYEESMGKLDLIQTKFTTENDVLKWTLQTTLRDKDNL